MLTRRQLEDAARCTIIDCAECSMYCINTIETTRRCGRVALAFRDMLERLEWVDNDYCPICRQYKANGHANDCALAALLWGSDEDEYVSYVDEEEDEESEDEEG